MTNIFRILMELLKIPVQFPLKWCIWTCGNQHKILRFYLVMLVGYMHNTEFDLNLDDRWQKSTYNCGPPYPSVYKPTANPTIIPDITETANWYPIKYETCLITLIWLEVKQLLNHHLCFKLIHPMLIETLFTCLNLYMKLMLNLP